MKAKKLLMLSLAVALLPVAAHAQEEKTEEGDVPTVKLGLPQRLTIGTYGEATYRYNFFSDRPSRYINPDAVKDDPGHGRVDIPHGVIMMNYDFGKGWSFGSEIEFEHGGTEAAVEVEGDEAREYEREIERGGEVALEQFWIQKSFGNYLNIRAGHIIVPVGATNNAHEPNNFFGVFRPEGENTILPCTWHETGLEVWGRVGDWRYDLMAVPSLNSAFFSSDGFVHSASASPFEYRVANKIAGAARIDNFTVPGLRLSLSGYIGRTFDNDIPVYTAKKYADVKGLLCIGAFDFNYRYRGLVVRGNFTYGHLDDANEIILYMAGRASSTKESPYSKLLVGEEAYAAGIEAGYNVFEPFREKVGGRQLYIFGRYDNYDTYIPAGVRTDVGNSDRQCYTFGLNYRPIPQIIVKAEYGVRLLSEHYNNEPWVALGMTWVGMFN